MSSTPPAADSTAAGSYEVPDIPLEYQMEWERHKKERDRIRSELRLRMWYRLYQLTGVFDPFGMRWTDSLFMSVIVGKYNCGLEGWPPDIPFQNLGYIGKTAPLKKLLGLWKEGKMRIVRLSDDELAQAAEDPESVLPNTTLRAPSRPGPQTTERVIPLVFHPVDMHELSQPSSAAGTSSSTPRAMTTTAPLPQRKRKQRSDTKLARTRSRHYGGGVKSREYVYDEESNGESEPDPKRFREALSDDIVEEFPVEVVTEAEAEAEDEVEVEDEIEEFTEAEAEEADEIESDTESWLLPVGEESDTGEAESSVE